MVLLLHLSEPFLRVQATLDNIGYAFWAAFYLWIFPLIPFTSLHIPCRWNYVCILFWLLHHTHHPSHISEISLESILISAALHLQYDVSDDCAVCVISPQATAMCHHTFCIIVLRLTSLLRTFGLHNFLLFYLQDLHRLTFLCFLCYNIH